MCENNELIVYECTCGDNYTEAIPATGHNDNNGDGNCDACGLVLVATRDCSCNCHNTDIASIIRKILRFFYKLFKTNAVCACGVKHY